MLLKKKVFPSSILIWFLWMTLVDGKTNYFRGLQERFFQRSLWNSNIIRRFFPEDNNVYRYHTPNADIIVHYSVRSDQEESMSSNRDAGDNRDLNHQSEGSNQGIDIRHLHGSELKQPITANNFAARFQTTTKPPSHPKFKNVNIEDKKLILDTLDKEKNNNPKENTFSKLPVNSKQPTPFPGLPVTDENEEHVIPIIPADYVRDIFDDDSTETINNKEPSNKTDIIDKASGADKIPVNSINNSPPEKESPENNYIPYLTFDNLEDLLNKTLPNKTTVIVARSGEVQEDLPSKVNPLNYKPGKTVNENFLSEPDPANPPAPLTKQPNTLLMEDWIELSKKMYNKLGPEDKRRVYEANRAIVAGKYLNDTDEDDGNDVELKLLKNLYLVAERKRDNNFTKDNNKNETSDRVDEPKKTILNRLEPINISSSQPEYPNSTDNNNSVKDTVNFNEIDVQDKPETSFTSKPVLNKNTTISLINSIFDIPVDSSNLNQTGEQNNEVKNKNIIKTNSAQKIPLYNFADVFSVPNNTNKEFVSQNIKLSPEKQNVPKYVTTKTKYKIPSNVLSIINQNLKNDKPYVSTDTMNSLRRLWTSGSKGNTKVIPRSKTSNTITGNKSTSSKKGLSVVDNVLQEFMKKVVDDFVKTYTENTGRQWLKRTFGI